MPLSKAIIVTLLIGLIVFCERLFPFALFSRRKPGNMIHIFERYIPPLVMIGLLIYSLRDVRFAAISGWLPQFSAISFTIVTYLWKKNSLVSIFGATIIYMILIRIL
ncbi:MAG: AzlD domain-containing protein [Treponema sp.]|nr:AzlD domain-containing protein [Treponema sp.]